MSDKKDLINEAIKRRQGGGKSIKQLAKYYLSKSSETGSQSGLNFYQGNVSSLKVQLYTILIISLLYVVLVHNFSKLRSGGSETPTEGLQYIYYKIYNSYKGYA